jgi:hypothetical protein
MQKMQIFAVGNENTHAVNRPNQLLNPFRQSTRHFAVGSALTRTPRTTLEYARPFIGAFDVFLILVQTTLLAKTPPTA